MIAVARCRELLGSDAPEKDADVEVLRDSLYGLAGVVLDSEAERAEVRFPPGDDTEPAQEAACAR